MAEYACASARARSVGAQTLQWPLAALRLATRRTALWANVRVRGLYTVTPSSLPIRGTMAPMRILHLVTRSHRRGAELAALDLARELDTFGHHNRMLSLGCAF